MLLYFISACAIALTAISTFLWAKYSSLKHNIDILEEQLSEKQREISDTLPLLTELRERKTEAETKNISLLEQIAKLDTDKLRINKEKELAIHEKHESQKELEITKERINSMRKEMENWEKTKQQHIEAAKASVIEAGSKLSSKLLDDHKRENEESKKESEKRIKETTEELHKKFHDVFDSMAQLHQRVSKSSETVNLIERSLLSPSGAGALAEITLENILKNSGLTAGQDYIMQHSISNSEGKSLRPDAVIFLPGDNIVVIDSKASKFFVEMEKDDSDKQVIQNQLKTTMNNHLKDLVKRDYKQAIEDQIKQKAGNATVIMFLPTETALDKLRAADNKFEENAWKEQIIPVGPSGLVNLLLQAKYIISNARQEENSKVIIEEIKMLLSSIAKLNELSQAFGRGVKSLVSNYDKFAASFNSNFLSKTKRLEKLGVSASKGKSIDRLERYTIVANDIEGEVFSDEDKLQIEFNAVEEK